MQVLTNAQWAKFEAAIAVNIRGARPRKEDRRTIEAIIWRLDNGAKWRSIQRSWAISHHAYLRFRRWAVRGVWNAIMAYVASLQMRTDPTHHRHYMPSKRRHNPLKWR